MGSTPPQVIAHRGYATDNPENTVAAMRAAAADERTNGVEIDVRLTADDRVIVFHDDDLSRLTDAPPAVSNTPVWKLSYDEISQYTVGDSDASIPLLADVLVAIPSEIGVNLELKHPGREGLQFGAVDGDAREAAAARWQPFVERALDVATATDHDLLVSSFYEGALTAARRVDPAVPLAPIVADSAATGLTLARRYDAAAIHPAMDLVFDEPSPAAVESSDAESATSALVANAHDAGCRVNVWTVTDRETATALVDAGVDGLIADTPAVVPNS